MTTLEEIYRIYFKDVFLFLLSLTKDKNVAEDLTHETFIKALKGLKNFRGDSHIKKLFFVPVSYLLSQLMLKGFDTTTYDGTGDLAMIIMLSVPIFIAINYSYDFLANKYMS